MARVALDAMGGDFAPREIVLGAVAASADGYDAVLVGDDVQLRAVLSEVNADLPVVHASQSIGMADDPARAIRDQPDSSIVVAANLVKSGSADALVSAGSTGAVLAAAAIIIGRIPGVSRPSIASVFPTTGSHTILLDSGANPDCKPEHLVQFGVMGSLLAEIYLDCPEPRVGLLSIGEERGKGRDLERAAYEGLDVHPRVNFVGNVEGRDLASDVADVFVTDGFTGNVLLKTTEGVITMMFGMLTQQFGELPEAAAADAMRVMGGLGRQLSAEVAGGAHLIGSKGVVVICHGSSSALAIRNAVEMAADGADRGLVAELTARLATS